MIFMRYKISSKKIEIWDKIHLLQENSKKAEGEAKTRVEGIYLAFNELTGKDPDVKYNNKDLLQFYKLSLDILGLIVDNYSKDKQFRCLRVLSDLLCIDLWQRAYGGIGEVDMSTVNAIQSFINEEKRTIIAYCGEIASQDGIRANIELLQKNGNSPSLDSFRLRYANGNKLITGYETELNAKLEEMIAKQQKGAINSDSIISSFKYSDEVMKENDAEFEKVKKASDSHYAFVRADREAFLIDQQNDNNQDDQVLSAVEKEINGQGNLFERVQKLIDSDYPDIVGAYANLRFCIDSYSKYVCGIDFNLGFNGRKTYSSKNTFNVMFGYGNGARINDIWDKSSDIMHAGDERLTLDLNPQYISSLKGEVLGYAKTLDELIGDKLDNVDFVEGVKRLFIARYDATKEFIEFSKEKGKNPGNSLFYSNNQLNSYKDFLIKKGVEKSFFNDYPELKAE